MFDIIRNEFGIIIDGKIQDSDFCADKTAGSVIFSFQRMIFPHAVQNRFIFDSTAVFVLRFHGNQHGNHDNYQQKQCFSSGCFIKFQNITSIKNAPCNHAEGDLIPLYHLSSPDIYQAFGMR